MKNINSNLSPATIKTIEILQSWNQFYTILGTPNRESSKKVQDQIKKLLITNES